MDFNELINTVSAEDKKILWNRFRYEEQIDDMEANLLRDFQYYSNLVRHIDETASAEDMMLSILYKKHIKNIHHILNIVNELTTNDKDEAISYEENFSNKL